MSAVYNPSIFWPTCAELTAEIGGKNWVVARRTPRIVAQYGEDVICLTPKAYREKERLAHLRRTEGFD